MSKLVTYEQAKKLLELGYNKPCWRTYFSQTKQLMPKSIEGSLRTNTELCKVYYSAPLVSEALDFIREERGLRCAVELVRETNRFGDIIGYKYGGAYINQDSKEILLDSTDNFSEAESALLTAVLEYLKKGGNNE